MCMVGIRLFPFGARPIFRCENVNFREGSSNIFFSAGGLRVHCVQSLKDMPENLCDADMAWKLRTNIAIETPRGRQCTAQIGKNGAKSAVHLHTLPEIVGSFFCPRKRFVSCNLSDLWIFLCDCFCHSCEQEISRNSYEPRKFCHTCWDEVITSSKSVAAILKKLNPKVPMIYVNFSLKVFPFFSFSGG